MKKFRIVGAVVAAALLGAGITVPAHSATKNLVIWCDNTRVAVIKAETAAWAKANNVNVQVVVSKDVRNDFVTQARNNGPDIIVGANDWVGQLAANGLISIQSSISKGSFAKSAIDAFSYRGNVYGVPYAIENIALFTNTKLVPTAPTTFNQLEQTWLSLKASNPSLVEGIDVPAGSQGDAYHGEPFLSMLGGYIFQSANGTIHANKIGVSSPAFQKNAATLDKWFKEGLLASNSTYNFDEFTSGKAPFAVTGPWELSAIRKSGIPYTISAIPAYNGVAAQPFVGVQGFMLSSFAKNRLVARQFLRDVVSTPKFQYAMYSDPNGQRYPALIAAQSLVASDKDTVAFGAYGATGTAMPNIPQMSSVWGALGAAWKAVGKGQDNASHAFAAAQDNIVKAINS